MRKISIPACICACLLTWLLTLTGIFFYQRLYARIARAKAVYTTEDKLAEAAEIIRENFIGEYAESDLTDNAIDGMIAALGDRWSYYMTAEEVEEYARMSANSYGGIGIVIQGGSDESATVLKVYALSPAGEAGVQPGSLFLSVNGRDVAGMDRESLTAVVREAIQEGQVDLRLLCPDGETREYSLSPGDVYTAWAISGWRISKGAARRRPLTPLRT